MPPHDLFWREYSSAAKDAGGVHLHDLLAGQCDHVTIDKYNVSAPAVTRWKDARVTLGLSGVWRLERAKPRFSRHSIIEEQRRPFRRLHFAESEPFVRVVTGRGAGRA